MHQFDWRGRCGHDCMVVELPVQSVSITAKVVSLNLVHGEVLDTTLCDKVCQRLAAGWWFNLISSTNKPDCHDITEILLKVVLNSITLTLCIAWEEHTNVHGS